MGWRVWGWVGKEASGGGGEAVGEGGEVGVGVLDEVEQGSSEGQFTAMEEGKGVG